MKGIVRETSWCGCGHHIDGTCEKRVYYLVPDLEERLAK